MSSFDVPSRASFPDLRRLNTWQAIRAEVLDRIRSGQWPAGSLIPTEHELAHQMGCARATVNRALRDLAETGIIERRRKVGTRVAARPSHRTRLNIPTIRDEVEAVGGSYGYRLLEAVTEAPTDGAIRALKLAENQTVMMVRALHMSDGAPWCCEMVWLNRKVLPDLERGAFEQHSPHDWLAAHLPGLQARFSILSEPASATTAQILAVQAGSPALVIERVDTRNEAPVAYSRQLYRQQHRLLLQD